MSIEFAVFQLQWSEFEAAVKEDRFEEMFWENPFAIEDEELDFLCDNETSQSLFGTEFYIKIRSNLDPKQLECLDEIVGALIWNCDVPKPTDPPFTKATNRNDLPEFQREAVQALLSPTSVGDLLLVFEQLDYDAFRIAASETLGDDKLHWFGTSDAFVDYVLEWQKTLERARSEQHGIIVYVAI